MLESFGLNAECKGKPWEVISGGRALAVPEVLFLMLWKGVGGNKKTI